MITVSTPGTKPMITVSTPGTKPMITVSMPLRCCYNNICYLVFRFSQESL